eukprot:PITA_04854
MAEGLGCHIKQALLSQQIKGLSVHNSPTIAHQQFVDDNMLFGYPSVQETSMFKFLLNDFSKASGTSINKAKSQIFFFHTPPIIQRAIAHVLGFSIDTLPSKYLGAPLTDLAIKHASWRTLLEKLDSRLNLWTHRSLNIASTNHKWDLVKWTTVCKPKEQGGIGLRDPSHSNAIMCAKIWWQWLSTPNKPWAAIWTTKYANHRPQEELIILTPNTKGSLIWNAAKQHFLLIQQHSFWEVRNDRTTRLWMDAWNQLPKLNDIIRQHPGQSGEEQHQEEIWHYWTQETEQGYRKWQQSDKIIRNEDNKTMRDLERELQNRRIRYSEGRDIL